VNDEAAGLRSRAFSYGRQGRRRVPLNRPSRSDSDAEAAGSSRIRDSSVSELPAPAEEDTRLDSTCHHGFSDPTHGRTAVDAGEHHIGPAEWTASFGYPRESVGSFEGTARRLQWSGAFECPPPEVQF